MILFLLPDFSDEKETAAKAPQVERWWQKFRDLYQFNRRATLMDLALAVSVMGTVAYMSRIAGKDQSWLGLFLGSYGLAAWMGGFLERVWSLRLPAGIYWFLLGFSFWGIGLISQVGIGMLAGVFLKDLCFWILYHRISSHIQFDTPMICLGGVSSARLSLVTVILATGEILVGTWSPFLGVAAENGLRGLFVIAVGCLVIMTKIKDPNVKNRPAL